MLFSCSVGFRVMIRFSISLVSDYVHAFILLFVVVVLLPFSLLDNCKLKSHKYVCITTYEPDTESNPYPGFIKKYVIFVHLLFHVATDICKS